MGELIKVATLSEIPAGTCLHVEVAGREVAIFQRGGHYLCNGWDMHP